MSDETLLRLLGRVADNIQAAREAILRGKRELAEGNLTCAHSLIDWIELRRNAPELPVPVREPSAPSRPNAARDNSSITKTTTPTTPREDTPAVV